MKAIVYSRYGTPDVLGYEEIEQPVPQPREVLVRVHAASVNAADWHLLTADIFLVRLFAGLLRPRHPVLGADIAGQVEAVGEAVTQFKVGDAVYGDIGVGRGAFAEYAAVPVERLCAKPRNLSYEQAAAVPLAALTALQALRDQGRIQPGMRVLIQGASGGVGTYAVQIAKAFEAEVTAVCSPRNLEQTRGLGADHVIDYTQEDFTRGERRYDLILAVNGYHPLWRYRQTLAPHGVYVMAGGAPAQMYQALLLGPLLSSRSGPTLSVASQKPNPADLNLLKTWIEAGRLSPVIDRRYPLSETAAAMRYLGQGHARGKIVITINAERSGATS